ncbi:MAG: TMEM175 family protein [Myxococcota bacterium]
MSKSRLEAFSDGVIAIIITIMVLEMKVPAGTDLESLRPLLPVFSSYALSFVYVGIYWNNHHHLLHATHSVTGRILWLNLHLLFWLSLFPFATAWIGESRGASWPTVLYGAVLFAAGTAYQILESALIAHHGRDSALGAAVGRSGKEWLSIGAYAAAIALAFVRPWLSQLLYAGVAALWFVPDRRIESALRDR